MKKILKKIANTFTEKSFTIMGHFQPKMPKALRKEIESKKD